MDQFHSVEMGCGYTMTSAYLWFTSGHQFRYRSPLEFILHVALKENILHVILKYKIDNVCMHDHYFIHFNTYIYMYVSDLYINNIGNIM